MSKNIFYRVVLSCLLLHTGLFSNAQQRITVKAAIDRNKILIGEPIKLKLEVTIPENEPIRFFVIDSIGHFEFLNMPVIDTINTASGTVLSRTITLTSFDSGHWVIPSFVLADTITTDTIPVDVTFSSPFDAAKDYHDIKDIIEARPPKKNDWLWYALSAAIILLPVIVYLLTRKKKPVVIELQVIINPYEEAMSELEKIKKENPDSKEYYSRLTDVWRVYVFKKKGILSLQETTAEMVLQLKNFELGKEQSGRLTQALLLSDFVKFAQYIPTKEEDIACYEEIKQSIILLEKSAIKTPQE